MKALPSGFKFLEAAAAEVRGCVATAAVVVLAVVSAVVGADLVVVCVVAVGVEIVVDSATAGSLLTAVVGAGTKISAKGKVVVGLWTVVVVSASFFSLTSSHLSHDFRHRSIK